MSTEKCKCNLCDMIKHTTWIDVNSRLPNEGEDCLIYSQDGLYALATYLNKKWLPFFGPEFIKINFRVVAWMILPPPPNMMDG